MTVRPSKTQGLAAVALEAHAPFADEEDGLGAARHLRENVALAGGDVLLVDEGGHPVDDPCLGDCPASPCKHREKQLARRALKAWIGHGAPIVRESILEDALRGQRTEVEGRFFAGLLHGDHSEGLGARGNGVEGGERCDL